jgi:hypothetical protein
METYSKAEGIWKKSGYSIFRMEIRFYNSSIALSTAACNASGFFPPAVAKAG